MTTNHFSCINFGFLIYFRLNLFGITTFLKFYKFPHLFKFSHASQSFFKLCSVSQNFHTSSNVFTFPWTLIPSICKHFYTTTKRFFTFGNFPMCPPKFSMLMWTFSCQRATITSHTPLTWPNFLWLPNFFHFPHFDKNFTPPKICFSISLIYNFFMFPWAFSLFHFSINVFTILLHRP